MGRRMGSTRRRCRCFSRSAASPAALESPPAILTAMRIPSSPSRPGPNGKTQVKIFDINGDGSIGTLIDSFFAFGAASKVGVQVAAGDINNDGLSELFVATDRGGGRVREYRDTDGDALYSDNLVDQLSPFGT